MKAPENSRTTISVDKSTHEMLNKRKLIMEIKVRKRISWDYFFEQEMKK